NDTWTPDATQWTDAPGWPDGVEINLDATTAEWALWQQKVAANSITLGADRTSVSAPIIITHGGTYQGNWQSLYAEIPAVEIRTSEPVIIENSIVRSRGTLIDIYNYAANVTVRNTTGYGLNPDEAGTYVGRFMDVDGWVSITAQNNYLQSTAGIYLADYTGDGSVNQTVAILRNEALNIDGRASNGTGGWAVGSPDPNVYRQFFQINGATLSGAEVAWNQVINEPGHSRVEENINIFASNGTPASPFLIHDNYIRGAFPADAIDALDYTGGGIMVSDTGSSYIQAFNNQIVSTGGIGMSISSGHDNSVFSNRVISSGLSPTGAVLQYSNTGVAIWNANQESTFTNNSGHDNYVGWVSKGQRNDWWVPDTSSWTNNVPAIGPVTRDTELAEWNQWLAKLVVAAMPVGPAS
ncbi:MAG: glycosyl hydrolase, partial [Tepidisphaeraceae bacterium]